MKRRQFLQAISVLPFVTHGLASSASEESVRGGVLSTILNPEPGSLILGINNQAPTLMVSGKIYQGLLTYNAQLEPQPSLAKSWEISSDGRTYTFRIQEGVRFHDGTPLTARDVVFSIAEFHKKVNPRSRAIFEKIQSAVAKDDHTAIFMLDSAFEPFILMFDAGSAAIVPAHIYQGSDFAKNPANATPIGTGPFKFKKWDKGSVVQLVRNEDYWRKGLPYLDEILYRVIPDSQSRALALETGDVQLAQGNDIEPFDVPRFKNNPNFEISNAGNELIGPVVYLDINHRVKPLNDPRFRRAMQYAIDRKFMVDRLWFGIGEPAAGPFARTTRYFDASQKLPEFNPKKAREILDEMGLTPKNGARAEIKLLALPYGEVWTRAAEYVKQALSEVGIRVTLETTDPGTWASRIANWDYDVTFNWPYQWGDPSLGIERIYVSSNIKKVAFSNTGGYSNPEIDRLFADAAKENDPAKRRKLFSDIQDILISDNAEIYLFELKFPAIYNKKLKNVITTAVGVNGSFDEVHFAK